MAGPTKGRADYLELGSWNAICSMCGRKRKAGDLVRNWQGMYRCPEHNEARHPQDFAKGIAENPSPPWVQPMPDLTAVNFCTPNGISAVPGTAEPGCIVPGYLSPSFNPSSDI